MLYSQLRAWKHIGLYWIIVDARLTDGQVVDLLTDYLRVIYKL